MTLTRPASSKIREFGLFFGVQAVNYGLLCWNYRAIAQAHYLHIGLSDMAVAALNFLVIKKVAESKGWAAMSGYVLGGVSGSLLSVWLTTKLFGG